MGDTGDLAVFGVVLALRLLVPLLILRFPLPAILACLVLDAVDQTVFETFTTLDLSSYQSYDKALDVHYLALAYISTLRNWESFAAFTVSRFLFYYRLVGVALFELTGAEHRALLLVFPNTFEYFFIAVELVALGWRTASVARRAWTVCAAAIWIGVKLPQEYWIHVAQLDFTDAVRDHPVFGAAVVVALVVGGLLLWFVVRPRVPAPDHRFTVLAPDLPGGLGSGEVRRLGRAARGRVFGVLLLEKVVLVAFVATIFSSILPGVEATVLQITLAVAVLVTVDSAVGLAAARAGSGFDAAWSSFLALTGVNLAFVGLVRFVLPGERHVDAGPTMFFLLLLTLIVTLFDRYAPVHSLRARNQT